MNILFVKILLLKKKIRQFKIIEAKYGISELKLTCV